MSDPWYELVAPEVPLSQGDIVFQCPVLAWKGETLRISEQDEPAEKLMSHVDNLGVDVVVMTQACDLEHNKIQNVTLCAHFALDEYKAEWEAHRRTMELSASAKAWRKQCDSIKNGFVWNLSMLNEADLNGAPMCHRVVDFHHLYTAPRVYLESLIKQREVQRPRLLPPYREHLSQAFARFYMRVGLPVEVSDAW